MVWRVGDGHNVKIWGDRWLPTPISFAVQSPPCLLATDSMVEALMDRDQRGWNVELLRTVFSGAKAEVIINIPICPAFPPDWLVWRCTSTGIFSVCSAYHLGKDIQRWTSGACSSPEANKEVWKVLWSLKVPNPVKVFLWKACHNLFPTKVNLFKKKIVGDFLCPCCGREDETILHILWDCPSAQDVWGCGASCFKKCYTVGDTFLLLFEHFLSRFDLTKLELLMVVARRIWLRRNALVFKGKFIHPNTLYAEAVSACEAYYSNNVPMW